MTIETEAFDALHARYLTALAAGLDPALSEEENLAASEEDDKLMHVIAQTPAPTAGHVDIKCAMLARLMEMGDRADNLDLFMLASVRADLVRLRLR